MLDRTFGVRAAAGTLAAMSLVGGLLATTAHAGQQGTAAPPIVGGQAARIADHPYVVHLTDGQGNQFCGGTIGAANKVITAAHCVEGEQPTSVRVIAGREDKSSTEGVEAGVTGIWTHPNYQHANTGSDVAVLTLDKELSQAPLPVATPEDTAVYEPGRVATVLGWGATSEGGSSADVLQKAEVPLTSDDDCKQAYSQYDPQAMVCAGYAEGGVDACQGDSGGPLVVDGKLVGIVSTGNGCARPGNPGIYTRTSTYAADIQAQLAAGR
ncbi:serine protease [Saccharopolyspora rhizosphaerae]|uniref:Serine protease n=1 Tax=Saccharopolyspora rhizosphaerae TaxID=2492662 RepID=A0A3R8QND1_9PSEU|nr:serine protease [Saccharopolyspora rhizosphaerae]RRO16173.1 serine protease [Saccharopolyspora rhizosphaerae]